MFLLNSRLGLLAAASANAASRRRRPAKALLLPKLRSDFAEFLSEESLVHLKVLTPTYLCRFAVRAPPELASEAFLAGIGSPESL